MPQALLKTVYSLPKITSTRNNNKDKMHKTHNRTIGSIFYTKEKKTSTLCHYGEDCRDIYFVKKNITWTL